MIVDAFMFHEEWECLEIRVRELEGLVDAFVPIEGTHTHAGTPRTQHPIDRYREISPKIQPLLVDLRYEKDAWGREKAQRREGISRIVQDSDGWLLVSDVDEMPSREVLERTLARPDLGGWYVFEQRCFFLKLNLEAPKVFPWYGTRLLRRSRLEDPNLLRSLSRPLPEEIVVKGGWHFSWLGSAERLVHKMHSYAHQEYNVPELANEKYLQDCIRLERTPHGGANLTKVPIDDTFPLAVRENPDKYGALIA